MNIIDMQDACVSGNLKQVKSLIKKGFDVNDVLDEGKTAICWSAEKGHYDLTKYLIQEGADVNFQEEDEGESVLIFVIQELEGEEMIRMVSLLINHGVKVDLADYLAWTPLIHAAEAKSIDVAKTLLEHGANPEYIPEEGEHSALSICEDDTVKELLISYIKV